MAKSWTTRKCIIKIKMAKCKACDAEYNTVLTKYNVGYCAKCEQYADSILDRLVAANK